MNTAKVAIACAIGVCLERGYHYEGLAGVGLLLLALLAFEARKRWMNT
jgi:hypothetical protein